MPNTKATDAIEFAYYDTGPPLNQPLYDTVIIIHGHTYHGAAFTPMLEKAHAFGFRIIVVNRRLYPGSTPYTKEESDAFQAGNSIDNLTEAFFKQGEYLLLAINNIVMEHCLRNVLLVGWSLGTAFLNVTVASIAAVSEDIRSNLCKSVKSIVWWDAPATSQGLHDPPTGGWIPLYDTSLTPEERGRAFGDWVVQYYPHKDLDKRDCNGLVYKITTPIKRPTFTGMPFEEFLTNVDLSAGGQGDDLIGDSHFQPVVRLARQRSIFNKAVRDEWGNIPFIILHGEESPYNVQWAVWKFEEEAKKTGLPIRTIAMPGANHFVFIDNIELMLETLKICI